jgi:hypothetical protein
MMGGKKRHIMRFIQPFKMTGKKRNYESKEEKK